MKLKFLFSLVHAIPGLHILITQKCEIDEKIQLIIWDINSLFDKVAVELKSEIESIVEEVLWKCGGYHDNRSINVR